MWRFFNRRDRFKWEGRWGRWERWFLEVSHNFKTFKNTHTSKTNQEQNDGWRSLFLGSGIFNAEAFLEHRAWGTRFRTPEKLKCRTEIYGNVEIKLNVQCFYLFTYFCYVIVFVSLFVSFRVTLQCGTNCLVPTKWKGCAKMAGGALTALMPS